MSTRTPEEADRGHVGRAIAPGGDGGASRSFPIEPHSLLPGAHWLPAPLRRRYWRLGAGGDWQEVALLGRGELQALFGPAERERFGPFTKSWISVRLP